ncbi:MAG: competence/damage-inducible protein A [Campylobacterota bacterium]
MKFFALIIGSEILNRRRSDAHFDFVSKQLARRGWEFWGSNIIKDDPQLITDSIASVAGIQDSVLFCFGGIGSTPDDYTRQCAADALSGGELATHPQARDRILKRFGDEAFPHRINMASLPKGASLLDNPVNNIPGFQLQERFFFTPGFPKMAHPMIEAALDRYYPQNTPLYRRTLKAMTSENTLIELMQQAPRDVEVSSLPKFEGEKRTTVISVAGYNEKSVASYFARYERFLHSQGIEYLLGNF